ncbi:hypothetical protein [Streptomyces sp. NPDC006355]
MIYIVGLGFLAGAVAALYGTRPGSRARGQAVAAVSALLLLIMWGQW